MHLKGLALRFPRMTRLLLAGAAVFAMAGTAVVAAESPALASTTYVYPVYHNQVCQRQGHFGASYANPWNPYTWYCYDFSIPWGVTFAGGLDINGWCQAAYGAHAELWGNTVWDWKCIRRV